MVYGRYIYSSCRHYCLDSICLLVMTMPFAPPQVKQLFYQFNHSQMVGLSLGFRDYLIKNKVIHKVAGSWACQSWILILFQSTSYISYIYLCTLIANHNGFSSVVRLLNQLGSIVDTVHTFKYMYINTC